MGERRRAGGAKGIVTIAALFVTIAVITVAYNAVEGAIGRRIPEAALANFRECLGRINSRANYEHFLRSGFPVLLREESRTPAQTLALAERIFALGEAEA